MRVSNYSVLVSSGHERDSGHVILQHGNRFTLKLGNHDHTRRCDATVEVDGKDVGTFRLDVGRTIVLERPLNDKGCFTFFKADSEQAVAAGQGSVVVDNRGLIKVTFKPEKKLQWPPQVAMNIRPTSYNTQYGNADVPKEYIQGAKKTRSHGSGQSCGGQQSAPFEREEKTSGISIRSLECSSNVSSGITGLTGESKQEFVTVNSLDYDDTLTTIISLRLVADNNPVKELKPVLRMNPIPAIV